MSEINQALREGAQKASGYLNPNTKTGKFPTVTRALPEAMSRRHLSGGTAQKGACD
jgi:hypothetical protein